jgi:hypothetical protein
LYERFITEVIGIGIGGGDVLYQRAPTFRAYLGNAEQPMGKLHKDEDYHHQPSELNVWVSTQKKQQQQTAAITILFQSYSYPIQLTLLYCYPTGSHQRPCAGLEYALGRVRARQR